MKAFHVLAGPTVLAAVILGAGCPPQPPVTNRNAGNGNSNCLTDATLRAIAGMQFYAANGCAACHCNGAEGGCNLTAPGIQGAPQTSLDARLRSSQQQSAHPVKLSGASDCEIGNLAVFLGTLTGGTPLQGTSSITRGYNLYIQAGCIACHLASGQGVNQGGAGNAIAGSDPVNIYSVLAGDVRCHPVRVEIPADPCDNITYIAANETARQLADTPPGAGGEGGDTDPERQLLAYFLSFIAPPPAGGVVEPCNNISGQICTVAGNGIGGYVRDDTVATSTLLYYPHEVALADWDGDGTLDLVVDDWNNHRIRVVFIDQNTMTAPRMGAPGQLVRGRIISIAGTDKTEGSDALNHPTDVAFDANGALVMANWHNQNIYRYPRGLTNGGDRDQLAGLCRLMCPDDSMGPTRVDQTTLALPSSVAIHPDGRIFFTEQNCARIRILTVGSEPTMRTVPSDATCPTAVRLFSDGMIETLAGRQPTAMEAMQMPPVTYAGDDGPARNALFNPFRGPTIPNFGISLSPENPPDELYIADSMNHCIRVIDLRAAPPTIRLLAGVPGMSGFRDGPGDEALFNFPRNVYVDPNHDVYVADSRNHRIRRIDFQTRQVTTIAGTAQGGFNGDNIPATQAQLNNPFGMVRHPDGRFFIGDTDNNRVRVIIP